MFKKTIYWRTLIFIVFAVLLGCRSSDNYQSTKRSEISSTAAPDHTSKLLKYEELLTAGATENETLPLILAVHGLGDRPQNFRRLIEDLPVKARVVLPRAPISWGRGFAWFKTRVASGDFNELASGIARAAKQNAELIDHLVKSRAVKGHPILFGFSQGGMISFELAVNHPEVAGLVIPISGMLPKPLWPREKKSSVEYPPIRALHGGRDSLISIEMAREAVGYLHTKGLDVSLTEYPEASHTINLAMRKRLFQLIEDATRKMGQ